MASRKLRTGAETQISKRGQHTRSINTNIIATIYMRRTVTLERTMGSEIKLVDAVGARTGRLIELCGHVHRGRARGQFYYWRREHYDQSILNQFYRK